MRLDVPRIIAGCCRVTSCEQTPQSGFCAEVVSDVIFAEDGGDAEGDGDGGGDGSD